MKSIFKLILAILIMNSTEMNACELIHQAESLEEMILSSASEDLVNAIVDEKIYINLAMVDFNENGVEIRLNDVLTLCLPHLCIDNYGVFIDLAAFDHSYQWECHNCGYKWRGAAHQWRCPRNGCNEIWRTDW